MKRILFIHATAMWYRIPFFVMLSEKYDIKYVFTHIQNCKKQYGVDISYNIEGLETVNYDVNKSYCGVAFGTIKDAFSEYDVLVGGSWDSLAEVVETTLYFSIAKLRRKPFVIWRENWTWKGKSLKNNLIRPFAKFLSIHSDAILVPGTKHRDFFEKMGASKDKIFIMPNVSNICLKEIDSILEKNIRHELKLNDKKVILYVGRLIKRKGVKYLLEAFSIVLKEQRNYILIIVGKGECREELENYSHKLGIKENVHFIGYIEDSLLSAYYLLCDVFVVPSISFGSADPCPLTVNEAMTFGKPIICTDAVGASFDMIKNGENGFIVPEKDSIALSIAISKILSNYDSIKNMGDASKRIIEQQFTYSHMLNGFDEAINKTLNVGIKSDE